MGYRAPNITCPFATNQQDILVRCLLIQLSLVIDVEEVQAHVLLSGLEQLGDLLLAEPDGLFLQAYLKRGGAVVALVEDHLTGCSPGHDGSPSRSATMASISVRSSAWRATMRAIST